MPNSHTAKPLPRPLPCKNLWMTGRRVRDAVTLADLAAALERIAPTHLAESWDNVGLLSGHRTSLVKRVMLTIDLTTAVHDEVIANATDLLISYHPPIFKPISHLRINGEEAPALAVALASYGVWVYSPHTALDTVAGGTNDVLAEKVGAKVTGSFSHYPAKGQYLKLVTFVPEDAVETVADALFAAGCGHIGQKSKYARCSFRTSGTGTFQGDDQTNPAVGQRGVYEHVPEIRLETILPADAAGEVVSALRAAHPYEEPAFDLLKMETPPEQVGLGRFAALDEPLTLERFAQRCKRALGVNRAWVVGRLDQKVSRLAIVAGSCDRLILERADRAKYDCVLTGELKHHHMLAYQAAGLPVVCLGHGNTERPVLAVVAERLRRQFGALDIRLAKADRDPFTML